MNKKELVERSKQAFDSSYRKRMREAVKKGIKQGTKIVPSNEEEDNTCCNCPEGCLFDINYPAAFFLPEHCSYFREYHHRSFQNAFDYNIDNRTPEAALGLLYRYTYYKNDSDEVNNV